MWIYRYTLKPRRALSALAGEAERHGALIRVGEGVADVHPWPELGDLPLDAQLSMLARGELTPLTRRSVMMAQVDAAAREDGRSMFDGLQIPASHWTGHDPPPGFDTAKVKCGRDFDPGKLPDRVRLRLDFNNLLDEETFLRLAATLPPDRVDFIEDPFPYDEERWREVGRRTGLRLALDRGAAGSCADVTVVKPAVQDFPEDGGGEIVVTSYMDHPVGQMGAAWVAARNAKAVSSRCGLFTHVLFEPNEFSEAMRAKPPHLLPPLGNGVGFDEILSALPWKKLT